MVMLQTAASTPDPQCPIRPRIFSVVVILSNLLISRCHHSTVLSHHAFISHKLCLGFGWNFKMNQKGTLLFLAELNWSFS